MRKIVLSALLVLFLSFGSAEGLAQEKSYITVEGSNLNNSVVVEVGAMAQTATPVEGEMTDNSKQERLAAINGYLMEDVKFGGGLLGHLDKGGKFEVSPTEVAPGQWEMTVLDVDLKGTVLLFKTISVQETENHSDFHRVPDDLTLAQAADILNKQIVMASNR
jgi:hypothetical protein